MSGCYVSRLYNAIPTVRVKRNNKQVKCQLYPYKINKIVKLTLIKK
jgi:hypothetical protein